MKALVNLYPEIIGLENLFRAAKATLAQGRRFRGEGAEFKFNLEKEVLSLHDQLAGGRYRHGKYRLFTIRDPKIRAIAAAPLRDRVLHHAVHDVIAPRIDKIFIHDSYACRMGKGTHRALDRAHHFLRANTYVIHLDVMNYFQSIDHTILKKLLAKYIGDDAVLRLLEQIIDSTDYLARNRYRGDGKTRISRVGGVNVQPFLPGLQSQFQGDESIRGLPLGNLTSQFFANLYLNELDQYAKHRLKLTGYVRYMDDMVLFSNVKALLREWEEAVRAFASEWLKLELHPGGGPHPTKSGVTFLGFRLFPSHRKLKRTSVSRFIRRMNDYTARLSRTGEGPEERPALLGLIHESVRSFNAHALNGNTYRIRKRLYDRFPSIDQTKLVGMNQRGAIHAIAPHC